MFYVRTTKTASGATAVQIVRYQNRKTIVVKHIGSATNPQDIAQLKQIANGWIQKTTKQQSLFKQEQASDVILSINKSKYLGFRYAFIYEIFTQMFHLFCFQKLENQLLLDLVLMRIIQPVSKLESLEFLSEMFGITYKRGNLYRAIASFSFLKDSVEEKTIHFAKIHLNFDFSIVFYDVTTLYFETSTDDELRRKGYSKDNKPQQPQILIGLVVNNVGFPVSYEIFVGNTFEGKTLLPAICNFKKKYQIASLTVVADAAMISLGNIKRLIAHNLSYIVGARMGNLPYGQIEEISEELNKTDGMSIRLETTNGLLICDFSLRRYNKDRYEMEKQIQKAKHMLEEDTAPTKRNKFLKTEKTKSTLNEELIEKATLLLGIKGYYSNLIDHDNETIIKQYHNLWHVEQAFRIAKNDLNMRPIYHFKKQTIRAHILICFMALAVSKYMEIQTGKSIKKIVKLFKSITDTRILNTITNEEIVMRQEISEEVKILCKTLAVSY